MTNKLSRRDFLKLASLMPASYFLPATFTNAGNNDLPNIIIMVFDAWSAKNVSLYGYPRKTTPNLDKLAEKAIVYHNHYAGGYFTIPGTASLLTGTLEWQHHLNLKNQVLAPFFRENNIFGMFPEYKRVAYSHNLLANDVLGKMVEPIDDLMHWQDLYLWANPAQSLFYQDNDISSVSWIRTMDTSETGASNSIFLSRLISLLVNRKNERMASRFPLGLPSFNRSYHFILEDAIDWLVDFAKSESKPFLTYFHLLPPHAPYVTGADFYLRFKDDGYSPPHKPEHFMSDEISDDDNLKRRQEYDEFILYVDAEIDRFFSLMESSGKLENTWVILTSDHGEIFERGLKAHGSPNYYDPIAKVPLLIFPPGQKERIDIHTPTSAVDILPTLKAIVDQEVPDWTEGRRLPPFNKDYPDDNSVYIVTSNSKNVDQPYGQGSLMLRRGQYKLIYHFGEVDPYKPLNGIPLFELFDLESDPEEMDNLFEKENDIGEALRDELFAKMREMGVKK